MHSVLHAGLQRWWQAWRWWRRRCQPMTLRTAGRPVAAWAASCALLQSAPSCRCTFAVMFPASPHATSCSDMLTVTVAKKGIMALHGHCLAYCHCMGAPLGMRRSVKLSRLLDGRVLRSCSALDLESEMEAVLLRWMDPACTTSGPATGSRLPRLPQANLACYAASLLLKLRHVPVRSSILCLMLGCLTLHCIRPSAAQIWPPSQGLKPLHVRHVCYSTADCRLVLSCFCEPLEHFKHSDDIPEQQ
jgi:hypothetical protein